MHVAVCQGQRVECVKKEQLVRKWNEWHGIISEINVKYYFLCCILAGGFNLNLKLAIWSKTFHWIRQRWKKTFGSRNAKWSNRTFVELKCLFRNVTKKILLLYRFVLLSCQFVKRPKYSQYTYRRELSFAVRVHCGWRSLFLLSSGRTFAVSASWLWKSGFSSLF